ncbi:hypothetical protein BH09ACT1_BH09ACT1_02240 [soil metagenome]
MIRFADRLKAIREPRARIVSAGDALPSLRVLLAFPVILLLLGAVLVAFGVNGTSSGAYYSTVYDGADPDLIAGHPQQIRSDEWNTGTSWTISQLEEGLPERNETFPGGMDAALPYDLPRADWSVAFRPHLLGFLFLDADHGQAWRWWTSGFALLAALYAFVVTMIPRRPVFGAALAVGFFFSPFFQWWYQSSTFWPAVWALATMSALVWAFKSKRVRSRWIWAAIVGYLTAVMAMGIYVPYILAAGYVVAFFGIGLVIQSLREGARWRSVLARVGPVFAGGAAGAVVTAIFLLTRASTVEGFLSTVYPGARLTPTGAAPARALARVVGSSFTESLRRTGSFLGANSSEASTFFLVGMFLIPVVAWAIVRQVRSRKILPWPMIGLTAIMALFLAYAFVPGWSPIAHVLYLDRIPNASSRVGVVIGLGIASIALLVAIVRYLDESEKRPGWLVSLAGAVIFLLSQVAIAGRLYLDGGVHALSDAAPYWWFLALASAASLFFFARRHAILGALAFLLATVPVSSLVNPIYLGLFDLRETTVSKDIVKVDKDAPGTWVGVGNPIITAMLVESGVSAYNGVQGAPSTKMWKQIDPTSRYRDKWDRIGFINWQEAAGKPKVSNPSLDQVVVTFDACSAFAQRHVDYVLSEAKLASSCVVPDERAKTDKTSYTIYRVIPQP